MKSPSWRIALVADRLVQRDRLTRVLLDLQHLLRRDVHFLGQLFGRGLAAQVLEQLTLDAAELVDHLDHVHRDADGAGLVGHRAGDGLADPPGGVRGELVALGVVELFDRADQAQVAFLDQVEERHAAAGVALGQRHHQAQVGFQQMVLRAVAVAADPHHVAALGGGQLLALLGQLGHQLGGVQAGLDALGQLDLFLGVEQRDLADLLEVGAHRVGRCGQLGVLAGLSQRLGFLFVPDEVAGGLVLLAGLGDLVVLGRRYILGGFGGRRLGFGDFLVGDLVLDGLVVSGLEVFAGPDPASSTSRSSPGSASSSSATSTSSAARASSVVSGSGAVAFFARPRVAGASAALARADRDVGRDLAAAALAGLAAAVLAPRAVVLVARLAGADPLALFAADAFLAGVLVAVRFTGSSVAGLAFVAATYTLSVLLIPVGTGMLPPKSVGHVECWRRSQLGYSPLFGRRPPSTIVTTVCGSAASSGKI